jgi:uncharacterized protein YndB with AHSA1/START domain
MTVEFSKSVVIPAPADVVWAALADFNAISRWAPNVDHSTAASDESGGVGAVRRVQAGRITLLERVVEWLPPVELAYQLIGLPPPAGTVITRWSLAEKDGTTQTTITTSIAPLPGPPGRVVSQVLRRQLASAADAMLTGLTAHVEADK